MAIYEMYIENKDPDIDKPDRRFVRIYLFNKPWLEQDLWQIKKSHINNWIGIGHGDLESEDTTLEMYYEDEDQGIRIKFFNLNYPEDCISEDYKSGDGAYFSPYVKKWCKCEWNNSNILPDESK